jgi:hypothetical protein
MPSINKLLVDTYRKFEKRAKEHVFTPSPLAKHMPKEPIAEKPETQQDYMDAVRLQNFRQEYLDLIQKYGVKLNHYDDECADARLGNRYIDLI